MGLSTILKRKGSHDEVFSVDDGGFSAESSDAGVTEGGTSGAEQLRSEMSQGGDSPEKGRRLARQSHQGSQALVDRFAFLRADSAVPIYIGIGVVMAGFAVIGVTWGEVAGKLNVALQLPYLVSGGLTGLGLIMVGITLITISAKRRDAADRARQLDQLSGIMKELRDALGGDPEER